MKKVKYIFLLFMLSGCSVKYNLNIDKNINLNENINIVVETEDEMQKIEEYNGNLPIDIEIDDPTVIDEKDKEIEYYDIKKDKDNKEIYFKYSYDLEKFKKNVFTNSCYEYITATKNDNELILATSKEFSCFEKFNELEDVTVTITSKYKLIDTNADNMEQHKYIWYINKDNANNKRLYLSLDTSIEELSFWEKFMRGDYFTPFTISILLLIIGSIIYFILKRKSNKVDAI